MRGTEILPVTTMHYLFGRMHCDSDFNVLLTSPIGSPIVWRTRECVISALQRWAVTHFKGQSVGPRCVTICFFMFLSISQNAREHVNLLEMGLHVSFPDNCAKLVFESLQVTPAAKPL